MEGDIRVCQMRKEGERRGKRREENSGKEREEGKGKGRKEEEIRGEEKNRNRWRKDRERKSIHSLSLMGLVWVGSWMDEPWVDQYEVSHPIFISC